MPAFSTPHRCPRHLCLRLVSSTPKPTSLDRFQDPFLPQRLRLVHSSNAQKRPHQICGLIILLVQRPISPSPRPSLQTIMHRLAFGLLMDQETKKTTSPTIRSTLIPSLLSIRSPCRTLISTTRGPPPKQTINHFRSCMALAHMTILETLTIRPLLL